MWSTKLESVPFPVVESQVPLPTDIVRTSPFGKSVLAPTFAPKPLIHNKLNTPCAACNEGIDKRTSAIGIVYHNGFGLCKNDVTTMLAEARVNNILHNMPTRVSKGSPFATPAPVFDPTPETIIPAKPF